MVCSNCGPLACQEFAYSSSMDHETARRGICALLRSDPDIEVTCDVADGLQAARKAKEVQPDVIVLDITILFIPSRDRQLLAKNRIALIDGSLTNFRFVVL